MDKLKSTQIGIVITGKGIRGVETDKGQIVNVSKITFDAEVVPPVQDSDYGEFLDKYLKQLVSEMNIKKGTDTAVLIDGQLLNVKPFKLFDMPVEAMKENIAAEMEDGLSKSEYGYEYGCRVIRKLPAEEGAISQVSVLGAALERSISLAFSAAFHKAGLHLVRIDLAENVRLKLIDVACLWQEFQEGEVSEASALLAKYKLSFLDGKLGSLEDKLVPFEAKVISLLAKLEPIREELKPIIDPIKEKLEPYKEKLGLNKKGKKQIELEEEEAEEVEEFEEDEFVLDIDEESWEDFDADSDLVHKKVDEFTESSEFPLEDDGFLVFDENTDSGVVKHELQRGPDAYLIRSRDTFAVLDITDYSLNLSLYINGDFYVGRLIMSDDVVQTDFNDKMSLQAELLANEISSVLEFMAYNIRDSKIDRLLLFGPDEEVQELIPQLEERLRVTVIDAVQELHWDPFGELELDDPGEYLEAYGATLVPRNGKDFTMVQEIKVKAEGPSKSTVMILLTFLITIILVSVTTLILNFNYGRLEDEYESALVNLEDVDVSIETLQALEGYAEEFRTVVGNVRGFSEDYITLTTLYNSVIKDHPEGVVITGIQNNLNVIGIDGVAESVQSLMHYIFFLEGQEVFDSIETRTTLQNDAGEMMFKLSAHVKIVQEEEGGF